MKLFDAHCHPTQTRGGGAGRVINSTHPDDWFRVIQLAKENAAVIAAIGLHPLKLKDAPSGWKARFLECLSTAGAVGEIGLDYRDKSCVDAQKACFSWQLEQASNHNLPVSIHCVHAFENLHERIKKGPQPDRGIHLHAFNGSAEQARQLIKLGAYFSFHAGQLQGRAKKAPAALKEIPEDRLFIETDAEASDGSDPDSLSLLKEGYKLAAEIRETDPEAFGHQVNANFKRYFLDD